jgi:hypothetical protein
MQVVLPTTFGRCFAVESFFRVTSPFLNLNLI